MYGKILIATDGSEYALRAARHGLQLAHSIGAPVVAIMVTPPWRAIALSEIAIGHREEEYAARSDAHARQCLAKIEGIARELGVACAPLHLTADRPYEAIIAAAADEACDLIVVGAHGRRGLTGLLLGSETVKILTHTKLPVLVYRE